eukprot:scpid40946/ scgid20687/ 
MSIAQSSTVLCSFVQLEFCCHDGLIRGGISQTRVSSRDRGLLSEPTGARLRTVRLNDYHRHSSGNGWNRHSDSAEHDADFDLSNLPRTSELGNRSHILLCHCVTRMEDTPWSCSTPCYVLLERCAAAISWRNRSS